MVSRENPIMTLYLGATDRLARACPEPLAQPAGSGFRRAASASCAACIAVWRSRPNASLGIPSSALVPPTQRGPRKWLLHPTQLRFSCCMRRAPRADQRVSRKYWRRRSASPTWDRRPLKAGAFRIPVIWPPRRSSSLSSQRRGSSREKGGSAAFGFRLDSSFGFWVCGIHFRYAAITSVSLRNLLISSSVYVGYAKHVNVSLHATGHSALPPRE